MRKIAVITGAGAGVGRATAEVFARQGYDVALLSRDPDRLARASEALSVYGVRALPICTDVADAAQVEAAADRVEAELGAIDVWVNVAMATVFSPVAKLTPAEIERGTRVTYLGQVHGMMAALETDAGPQSRYDRQCRFGACLPLGAPSGGVLRSQSGDSGIH